MRIGKTDGTKKRNGTSNNDLHEKCEFNGPNAGGWPGHCRANATPERFVYRLVFWGTQIEPEEKLNVVVVQERHRSTI